MKKFLIVSVVLIIVALVATVTVWYLLQGLFIKDASAPGDVDLSAHRDIVEDDQVGSETKIATGTTPTATIGDFTLTPKQQQAAEAVGLDPNTITVTDEMIDCAIETLGEERAEAIISGDAPTFLETLSLVPCLKQ